MIYLRKLYIHDLTHEVGITTNVHTTFFSSENNILIRKIGTRQVYQVVVNSATDLRLGGSFKSFIREEDGQVDDIVVFLPERKKYTDFCCVVMAKKESPLFRYIAKNIPFISRHYLCKPSFLGYEQLIDNIYESLDVGIEEETNQEESDALDEANDKKLDNILTPTTVGATKSSFIKYEREGRIDVCDSNMDFVLRLLDNKPDENFDNLVDRLEDEYIFGRTLLSLVAEYARVNLLIKLLETKKFDCKRRDLSGESFFSVLTAIGYLTFDKGINIEKCRELASDLENGDPDAWKKLVLIRKSEKFIPRWKIRRSDFSNDTDGVARIKKNEETISVF